MNRAQARAYYRNRQFYEIIKPPHDALIELKGPLKDIRITSNKKLYVQVKDGIVVQTFDRSQILTYKGPEL